MGKGSRMGRHSADPRIMGVGGLDVNDDADSKPVFLTLTPREPAALGKLIAEGKQIAFPGEGIYAGATDDDGARDGIGKFWFVDGCFYEGQWRANRTHGKGRMIYETGAVYVGDFAFGARHGMGRLTYDNGDMYEGSWVEDNKEGKGAFHWHADGNARYEGQWRAGVMHGQATGVGGT